MNLRPAAPPSSRRARAPDDGAVQAPAAIGLGLAALLLIPVLFSIAFLGTDNTAASACGQQPATQPGIASDAEAEIPATYLRLYQQTGQRYGVPWNLLAAIGEIESDHGRDPGSGVRSRGEPGGGGRADADRRRR